jgi:hypothetical protein
MTNVGIKNTSEYFNMYPKKLGIGVPASSEMDRTMKFGAFPM